MKTENAIERMKELAEELDEECNFYTEKCILTVIEELKVLQKYKKISELTKISCCTAQNCEALNNAIKYHLEINNLKKEIENFIKEELPDDELCSCCNIIDVNGVDIKIKLKKILDNYII